MPSRRIAAALCDVIVLVAMALLTALFLTGGGMLHLASLSVRLTSPRNATLIAGLVVFARATWLGDVPFPASRVTPLDVAGRTAALLTATPARARHALFALVVVSIVLRTLNAAGHPGFVTGDDVEIQTMTIGSLLHHAWPAWNLRNPFYPMVFIYPAQRLAYALGAHGPTALVIAGRLVVVAVATITLWLVYAITARRTNNAPTALLAAALTACSRLHLQFGGSEFPRPVASAFICAAFLLLMRPSHTRAAMAGALLGIGGALRFSELLFLAPATIQLVLDARRRDAVVVLMTGAAAAVVCLGVADWLYWGTPLFSVRNLIVYTLVDRQSSRGFQPPWFYLADVLTWTTPFVVLLAIWGARREWRGALWAAIPLASLSALPHKEARYLIPVLPFIAIVAAVGVRDLLLHPRRASAGAVLVVGIALAGELSGWRMKRTDDAVQLARELGALSPAGIAMQQAWRFGGPLYLSLIPLVEIDDRARDAATIGPPVDTVILIRETADPMLLADLHDRHFVEAARPVADGYVVMRLSR